MIAATKALAYVLDHGVDARIIGLDLIVVSEFVRRGSDKVETEETRFPINAAGMVRLSTIRDFLGY